MPIRYEIDPGLDFLLYLFEGDCSAREYFDLYHSIYRNDARRHHGMKILMDLSKAEFYFESENLREAIAIMAGNKEEGHPRDRVALFSKGSSMELLTKTLKLLGADLPMDLDIFHNSQDAVRWLGLTEQEKETLLFWQEFSSKIK